MASRPFWKGYLKLSLVTCPVAPTPAVTEAVKIRFHMLNRRTGNRVVSRYVDAESGKIVAEDDQAKGYARDETSSVVLDEEDLEAVKLESVRSIDIESFTPAKSIDWIWRETPWGIELWTLRYGAETRDPGELFRGVREVDLR